MYEVLYHTKVLEQDLSSINTKDKQRIRLAIENKLMTRPEIFGLPLHHSLVGYRKLRVGDYRIVFKIQKNIVYVLVIAHRKMVYMEADKRA